MKNQLYALIIGFPIAAMLGWFANRLLGPTADALGSSLLGWFSSFMQRRNIGKDIYLKLEGLMKQNHAKNGHRVFSERKTYLRDKDIHNLITGRNFLIRHAIKDAWIEEARIDSYNESDMFFAAMELFINELNKKDIQKIFEKHKDNGQAVLWPFLELVEEKKPKLLSPETINYLRLKQKEWQGKHDEKT